MLIISKRSLISVGSDRRGVVGGGGVEEPGWLASVLQQLKQGSEEVGHEEKHFEAVDLWD